MASLRVMNSKGDRAIVWDAEKLTQGQKEAQAAVKEAERIFAEERARGATAFRVTPGQLAEKLARFESDADTVIVPRIAGG
jgi:uncharacterized protein (DUF1800 family)